MGRLRFLTAGESHGEMLVGILEGVPAGLSLIAERDIDPILRERQKGYGRSRRQQIELDTAKIISGVRFGVTTGAPIALTIENKDWVRWTERMSVIPIEGEATRVTIPRPGHADLAGGIKYGKERDLRNVLERASARETAMRVAIGAIATTLLKSLNCESIGYVRSVGHVEAIEEADPFAVRDKINTSPLHMVDSAAEATAIAAIDDAKERGDTLGGIVECVFKGVPVGIGSHVQWDRKLDGQISQAVMSIQAVKAVELGAGLSAAQKDGSETHDPIVVQNGTITRSRNNAGGIEGGMSNGEPIIVRAAMKPISTLMRPLQSVDLATGEATEAHIERSDVCAVPALAIIVEQVVAFTIASALLDTFGGDTVDELRARVSDRRDALRVDRILSRS